MVRGETNKRSKYNGRAGTIVDPKAGNDKKIFNILYRFYIFCLYSTCEYIGGGCKLLIIIGQNKVVIGTTKEVVGTWVGP